MNSIQKDVEEFCTIMLLISRKVSFCVADSLLEASWVVTFTWLLPQVVDKFGESGDYLAFRAVGVCDIEFGFEEGGEEILAEGGEIGEALEGTLGNGFLEGRNCRCRSRA